MDMFGGTEQIGEEVEAVFNVKTKTKNKIKLTRVEQLSSLPVVFSFCK